MLWPGNGVTGCTRGECTSLQHNTCPNDRACYDSSCIGEERPKVAVPLKFFQNPPDPCGPTFCGGSPCCNPTANCRAVDHLAECSCPPGTEGEPRADRGGTCRRWIFSSFHLGHLGQVCEHSARPVNWEPRCRWR